MTRLRPWLLSAAAYTACALVMCHGVVRHPATTLPSDLGDPILNTWILWWNAHHTPLTASWWNGGIFFPVPGALAFSETLLGIAIFTTPLQWAGMPAVAAYNVAFVGSWVAAALAAHWLAWLLTRRHDAAFIAGLIYGFNPYRSAHGPQIQLLSSYWLPLAIGGLHRYLETGRARALILFAGGWFLQSLVSGYFLFFSAVLIALWIVWFTWDRWRRASAILLAWAAAAVALLPVLLVYRRVLTSLDLQRGIGEIDRFGADASALLAPTGRLAVWGGRLIAPRAEGELFFGFTALLLAGIVAARHWRRPIGRPASWLFAAAALPITLGLIVFFTGGFEIGPLSVTRAFKPISMGVWLTSLALLASGPFVRSLRARSAFGFYVCATAVLIACAFGFQPRAFGHRFWYQAPYQLLIELPGFSSVRVPARFAAVAILTLSTAAALAFDRIRPRSQGARNAMLAAIVAGIAVDSAGIMPAVPVTTKTDLPDLREAASVVELPIGSVFGDAQAMFRATAHGRPVVNGYSGYAPPHYTALVAGLTEGDPRTLEVIRRSGPLAVIVHEDPAGAPWPRMLSENGARPIGPHGGGTLFMVPGAATMRTPCGGGPVKIASLRANMGSDPRLALDGDRATGWHSERLQQGGEQVVIDLGALHVVESITLVHGAFARDFPRRLRIEAGPHESGMEELWSGSSASYTVEGTLADARMAPARFPVRPNGPVRFIALTQIGQANDAMWSIAELEVCGRLSAIIAAARPFPAPAGAR